MVTSPTTALMPAVPPSAVTLLYPLQAKPLPALMPKLPPLASTLLFPLTFDVRSGAYAEAVAARRLAAAGRYSGKAAHGDGPNA